MKYSIGDYVKFYPSVNTNQVFIGKISGVYIGMNQYNILYESSKYCIHEQFIIGTASADEIKIARFELTISEKDLIIKELKDTVGKFIVQLQAQVDVNIGNDKKIDDLCKDKAAMEVLLIDCRKTLEKAHREIADLRYKLMKCENENKLQNGWNFPFNRQPVKPFQDPIKKRSPQWSISCNDIRKFSRPSGCCVKSS
jgi:hypothetical protein